MITIQKERKHSSKMAARIGLVILYYLFFFYVNGVAGNDCLTNWTLLPSSMLCVQFQDVAQKSSLSHLRCNVMFEDLGKPNLLNFAEISSVKDFKILSTITGGKSVDVWNFARSNCSAVNLKANSSKILSNLNCSRDKLPYFCQRPSRFLPLGMESFDITDLQITASSYLTLPNTMNLLKFHPQSSRLNLAFTETLFKGAGWCSKLTNIIASEYIEVDFRGSVILSKLTMQYGFIQDCLYWVSSFRLKVYRKGSWFIFSNYDTVPSQEKKGFVSEEPYNIISNAFHVHFFNSTTLIAEKLRIFPLTANSTCSHHTDIFCLRAELYGFYFERTSWRLLFDRDFDLASNENDTNNNGIKFPLGSYGIPMPSNGCEKSFNHIVSPGYILRVAHSASKSSSLLQFSWLEGSNLTKESICLHNDKKIINGIGSDDDLEEFPPGSYCIYKYQECPKGFKEGGINIGKQDTGIYKDKVELANEVDIQDQTTESNTFIFYCCRNDSHENAHSLPFIEPFILLPTANYCQSFANASLTLLNATLFIAHSPNVTGDLYPYHQYRANLVTLYYCYYTPENHVDSLVISPYGKVYVNMGTKQIVSVRAESNGGVVTSGTDCNKCLNVSYTAKICNITTAKICLSNCTTEFKLSHCHAGFVDIIISLTTSKGLTLSQRLDLTVKDEFNTLLLANSFVNLTRFLTDASILPSKQFHSPSDFMAKTSQVLKYRVNEPDKLHFLLVVEQGNTLNFLQSLTAAYEIPFLVFNGITKYDDSPSYSPFIRYMSSPLLSNFRNVLRNSHTQQTNGIVLIRTADAVTFREYYTIFKENMRLLSDVVIDNDMTIVYDKVKTITKLDNVAIIMFLDSYRASHVLSAATLLSVTPLNGYLWISFSPKFVISNTFLRSKCFFANPPCHVVFNAMWNVFHSDEALGCDRTKTEPNVLSKSVNNLTSLISDVLIDHVLEDFQHIVTDLRNNIRPVLGQNILDHITSFTCLPSGSGLQVVNLTTSESTDQFMCQPGWNGPFCDVPFCTLTSCNQTHGKCIAPEVCKCNAGRFGVNCNGDCSKTCQHGTCNDGLFGDGKCSSCEWLYMGDHCDEKTIIYGFVAASLGLAVCGFFLLLYIVRQMQTQEQNAEAETEAAEEEHTMSWDDLETSEDIDFSHRITYNHLCIKLQYTSYMKATTFSGLDIFIKCLDKPDFQLSLGIRTELKELCKLSHNNIESLLGIIIGQSRIGIVTHVSNMGSLYDILHQKHIPITWEVKYSIMQDICRGMSYLHDVAGMVHGRLKSTNCILYRGWLVKVGDIGLRKIRCCKRPQRKSISLEVKGAQQGTNSTDEVDEFGYGDVDYRSLLWTAPEIVCCGATNLDQVIRFTQNADIYSFGIIISEIISRCPPYSQNTVMSIQHIVQAVGHLREAILNLGQLNNISSLDSNDDSKETKKSKQNAPFRPVVEESLYPDNETETSILKMLMESCWSEFPNERLPFAFCLEILELITPLKGSQTAKRAILLERETESLERFIGHDTAQIFKEQEKYKDLLNRMLPPTIVAELDKTGNVKPKYHENITVMVARLCNFDEIVKLSGTSEAIEVINYLLSAISVISNSRRLNVTEVNNRGDLMIFGSSLFVPIGTRHAQEITTLATRLMKATKAVKINKFPSLKVALQIGIHTGAALSMLVSPSSATYTMIGEAVEYAILLEKECIPNFVHISKKTVSYLNSYDFEIVGRGSYKLKIENQQLKTFWVSAR